MSEELRHQIVRRHHEGQSMRGIADDLKISRERVKRVLAKHQRARSGATSVVSGKRHLRPSLLDEYEEVMRQLLERYPHLTAVRMLEELRQRGFTGGYSILKERLRLLRQRPARPPVERFETAPGKQAQMDYAQYDLDFTQTGRQRVYLFSYLLAWSRRQYLCFTLSQDFATTIQQHVRAFEHLGGVAATCLYDNMKVVVARYEDGEPIYNTRFLAFATHYGFRPAACRPRRPETKGKVERPFLYVETNLLNGRTFRSLEHLNEVTGRWLAEVADVRIHRQTNRRPLDLHAEERPHLIPLPAQAYDTAEVVYRSVDCEGFVTYRQNQYSVPWRHLGQILPVRVTEEEVIVYGPHLEEVARHPLLPRSCVRQRQLAAEHRPPEDRRQQYELLERSFAELGAMGQQFWRGLLEAHRQGQAQGRKILALRALYHERDLVAALERALCYGAFSFSAIERILHVQAQPKTTLQMLAEQEQGRLRDLLQDGSVRPRPCSDYQNLLFHEDSHGEAAQPIKNQPIKNQPIKNQPIKNQPSENQPSENQPSENQPSENQPSENQPGEKAEPEAQEGDSRNPPFSDSGTLPDAEDPADG